MRIHSSWLTAAALAAMSFSQLSPAATMTGTLFSNGTMIRESPTLQSTGQTLITPVSGGLFQVNSFFDVFTELSIDGGTTWDHPANLHLDVSFTGPPDATGAIVSDGTVLANILRESPTLIRESPTKRTIRNCCLGSSGQDGVELMLFLEISGDGGQTWSDASQATTFSSVPVPAAAWLFGSALGVVGLRRRRSA